ncbi:hypothetical protein NLI96_g6917 [Meripilus lineatus]|uniref:F-box domain-containing protein n=1 Tax=Meripilus lineatus TaxID=2056292 RepID=A0AAD5V1W0_9APHY|nr:hypothetical protein NLI96_g6917 [Physisporinus lineatus]
MSLSARRAEYVPIDLCLLPVELFQEIIKCMDPDDQRNISLVSHFSRELTLPFVFGNLSYSRFQKMEQIRGIHQARKGIKMVIRKIRIVLSIVCTLSSDDRCIIFELLRTLPNLHTFECLGVWHLVHMDGLSELVDSIRHAPLSELYLYTAKNFDIKGPPIEGLSSLRKLSISWFVDDGKSNHPGGPVDHLYHLIQPSIGTLVELQLKNDYPNVADLDLYLLKGAGETLRIFDYTMQHHDENVLEIIPKIFPNLTKLALTWCRVQNSKDLASIVQDSHMLSLTKNTNLEDLQLSSDFELEEDDPVCSDDDYAWFVRSYKRRLAATIKVSETIPYLRKCNWLQLRVNHEGGSTMLHPFIIEGESNSASRDGSVRVVRGVKQWWMGRDHKVGYMEIVKCKLEDLPGSIVGENDSDSEGEDDE